MEVEVIEFSLRASDFVIREGIEEYTRTVPEITSEVSSNGVVLSYIDMGTGRQGWWSLPLSLSVSNATASILTFYGVGGWGIQILTTSGERVASGIDGYWIKVLIIPTGMVSKSGIDLEDYDEVAAYYGIN